MLEIQLAGYNGPHVVKQIIWNELNLGLIEGTPSFDELIEFQIPKSYGRLFPPCIFNLGNSHLNKQITWLYFEGPPKNSKYTHSSFAIAVISDDCFFNFNGLRKNVDLKNIGPIKAKDFDL